MMAIVATGEKDRHDGLEATASEPHQLAQLQALQNMPDDRGSVDQRFSSFSLIQAGA